MLIENGDLVKAYIAGLVDGEGCIFIGKHFDKRRGRCKEYFRLEVIFAMKNRRPLDYIKTFYGGTLNTKVHGGQNIYRERRYWRLTYCSINAMNLLKDVLPYLILKRDSALCAITFQEHVNVNRRARWEGRILQVLEERHNLYQQYRAAAETERESGLRDRSDSPVLQDGKL